MDGKSNLFQHSWVNVALGKKQYHHPLSNGIILPPNILKNFGLYLTMDGVNYSSFLFELQRINEILHKYKALRKWLTRRRERQSKGERNFKELAHMILETGKFMIRQAGQQTGNSGRGSWRSSLRLEIRRSARCTGNSGYQGVYSAVLRWNFFFLSEPQFLLFNGLQLIGWVLLTLSRVIFFAWSQLMINIKS